MYNLPFIEVETIVAHDTPIVMPGKVKLNHNLSEFKTIYICIEAVHDNGIVHQFTRRLPINKYTMESLNFISGYDTIVDTIDFWVHLSENEIHVRQHINPLYWSDTKLTLVTLSR